MRLSTKTTSLFRYTIPWVLPYCVIYNLKKGSEALEYIINQTEMKVVFATKDKANVLLKIASLLPTIKEIIVMDDADSDIIALGKYVNISVVSMSQLEIDGSASPVEVSPPKPDDIATICYTSGTTGTPKVKIDI